MKATKKPVFIRCKTTGPPVACLFGGHNAVNTVADGIDHLGFAIDCDRRQNEDGNNNVSLERVAYWLDELLDGLARGRA